MTLHVNNLYISSRAHISCTNWTTIWKTVLSDHSILLTWSQPTLKNARGFVTGYSLIYSCVKNNSIELKLYEVSEERFYLSTVSDSAVTCSVAVCARTIAGCGPLSEPVIVQGNGVNNKYNILCHSYEEGLA